MFDKALNRRTLGLSGAAFVISACTQASTAGEAKTQGTEVNSPNMPNDANIETKEMNMSDENWANLSKREWQERLTEQEFYVLRKEGTERPFTSPYNDNKASGTYVCAGCALPLFKSDTKFDSGTGWPSFFDHIDGAIKTKKDFKLVVPRTEYHCARCGGHQGPKAHRFALLQ